MPDRRRLRSIAYVATDPASSTTAMPAEQKSVTRLRKLMARAG